ncbi:MAG: IS5 family transposase [Methanophagales archaeon]|nr:IS5 family transposase [Methanophagales archaeon]
MLLNIDYRGLEGFLRGLFRLIHFDVPDYTTICRRVNKLSIEIKKTLIPYKGKEVVISLDSSGAKVANRGEWMRQKWKVRRGWIKVHISVDDQNKQVVGIEATDESISDTKEFENLVEQSVENVEAAGGKVVQANADGAYDSNDNFKTLESHDITPAIKIRENEGPTYRSKNPRKGYAREFRELGYDSWRDRYKYGKRWYSEGTFSAVKRKFGEFIRATKVKNMFHEVKLKYFFYNAIIKYDAIHGSFLACLI